MIYPKEPTARAIVDQRLHFDTGVLFTALRNAVVSLFQLFHLLDLISKRAEKVI